MYRSRRFQRNSGMRLLSERRYWRTLSCPPCMKPDARRHRRVGFLATSPRGPVTARRRRAAVPEAQLARGICFRLGVGECLPALRPPLLSEAGRGNPVHANIRSKGPLGALYLMPCCIHEGDTPSFLGLINNGLASFMSPTYGGWGGRFRGTSGMLVRPASIPLGQPRLSRLHRLSGGVQPRQAKKSKTGATQAGRSRRCVHAQDRYRYHRRRLGILYTCYERTYRARLDALFIARIFRTYRRDARRKCAARHRHAQWTPAVLGIGHL